MPRNLTDPNYDETFEWQERVVDPDGDSLSITVELDAVDNGPGWTQKDTLASNVSWLSYTLTTNTINGGETEVLVDLTADATALSEGYKYRFQIDADDGFSVSTRKVVMEVVGNYWVELTGSTLYVVTSYRGTSPTRSVDEYSLSTPWDVETAGSRQQQVDVSNEEHKPDALFFKPDGTRVYITGSDNHNLYQYDLSTGYDLSTATFSKSYNLGNDFASSTNDPAGLFLRLSDGKKLYVADGDGSQIYEYDLSTPWEIDSATLNGSVDVSGKTTSWASGIWIKPDGSKVILSGNDFFVDYPLSTTWDIQSIGSGINYIGSADITPDNFGDIHMRQDGKKLYFIDTYDEYDWAVHELTLTGAWDLSSGYTLETEFDLSESSGGSKNTTGVFIGE